MMSEPHSPMKKHLLVLLASLFVVSIGLGITLPVLPFYAERLAMAAGASHRMMVVHVGLLTGVFPLMQFLFAPLWGRLSDRVGRRPLFLVGIAGYGLAQLLFGMAISLWLLYGVRILGGILASATIPTATAYVADATDEKERGRGMAWLGTAVSLGAVAGPALGGLTTWRNWHLYSRFGHFVINSFSMPFLAAAGLTFLTLFAAIQWLPESLPARSGSAGRRLASATWQDLGRKIWPLLGLSAISQFGLALFMTVFALYAQVKLGYGPAQVGIAFMVCGSVMALFQALVVGPLSGRVSEMAQLAVGFSLMSVGIASLLLVRTEPLVFGAVALQALGMAFISPNLATLTSKRSGSQTGTALGLQNSANNLGQVIGPLLGGALFAWEASAPYLLTSISMFAIGAAIGLHRSARMSTVSIAA
jgi:DHA1 family multidrug resistance protein-like MFS transporter